MSTTRTKKNDNFRTENMQISKALTTAKPGHARSIDQNGAVEGANSLSSDKKQARQVIEIDDAEVAEIPKTMAIGSAQKGNSRKGPQTSEKGSEGTNKESNPLGNTQKKPSDALGNSEVADSQLKLPQGLLMGDFGQLGAQQPQVQNSNLLNFAGGNGYVIYMMPNGNGVPYQPYNHGLGQLGYPIIEVVYPHQLGLLNGANTPKSIYQQDFANRFAQIPAEYFNGQLPIIQPDPAAIEGIIKQQQKREDEARVAKTNGKQEKPSQLDGNILSEKEIAKAHQNPRRLNAEQISPNKLAPNISESNSGADDGGRNLNTESSHQGSVANTRSRRDRVCFNKYCQTDPKNPNLWCKNKLNGKTICKMCEDGWKKGQYCLFCHQIYVDNDKYCSDGTDWISCDKCSRWTHLACEEKPIQRKIKIANERNDEVPYYCPNCRTMPTNGNNPRKIIRKQVIPATSTNMYSLRKLDRSGNQLKVEEEIEEERRSKKADQESGDEQAEPQQKGKNSNKMVAEDEQGDEEEEEMSHLQRKLEALLLKRRIPTVKTGTNFESFAAFDTLLGQHGKKMKLSENEINHDLQFMRGDIKEELTVNQGSERKNLGDFDEEEQSDMNLEPEESKTSTRTGDRRSAGQSRPVRNKAKQNVAQVANNNPPRKQAPNNTAISKETNPRNEANTTTSANAPKRQTRSRAKME